MAYQSASLTTVAVDTINGLVAAGSGNSGVADQHLHSSYGDMFTPPCFLATMLTDTLAKSSSALFLILRVSLSYVIMLLLTAPQGQLGCSLFSD